MTEQQNILDHLNEVFREMESRLNGKSGSPIHEFHKNSFLALNQVQFPDRKHEDWRNTGVQNLITPKYKLPLITSDYKVVEIPGLDTYVIPVINGKAFLTEVSPLLEEKGIMIRPLFEALTSASWKEVFGKKLFAEEKTSNQAFELLNFTFNGNGFFLDVPKDLVLDKPIEIRIIHDDPEVSFSHPLYFIRAGSGSNISLFERFEKNISHETSSAAGLINSVGYLHLDQNAAINHIRWQDIPFTQNLVYKLLITQARDSRFESLAFDFGGSTVRNNVDVELEESNTNTSLQAGYLAKGRQSMDHQTRINHLVPHSKSYEHYKGIIDGQASGAFNGKVFVHPDAQKTNAFQQNDTLVLSTHAIMNSKPQLEIFADDVKCSHGATIGQMDEKALFYLKSRGIDTHTAEHILKSAFLADIVERIADDRIRQHIRTRMSLDV